MSLRIQERLLGSPCVRRRAAGARRPARLGEDLPVQRERLPAGRVVHQAGPVPLQTDQPVCDVHLLGESHLQGHLHFC